MGRMGRMGRRQRTCSQRMYRPVPPALDAVPQVCLFGLNDTTPCNLGTFCSATSEVSELVIMVEATVGSDRPVRHTLHTLHTLRTL